MRICDLIERYEGGAAVVEDGLQPLQAQDITQVISACRKSPLARIALSFSSDRDLVTALAMADGAADAILLLAPSTSTDVAKALMEKARVATIFGDRDDIPARPLSELIGSRPERIAHKTQWLIATSGTTGEPKVVSHTLDSLTRTTNKSTGNRFVWGQLYDSHRFAGMQVLLQALSGTCSLVSPPMNTPLVEKLRLFNTKFVNALSATPTLWRKILMSSELDCLSLKTITLGGEICDQKVLDALKKEYPQAKIQHIYASTEAGAAFSVGDGLAGFPIDFLDVGFRGILLDIRDGILYLKIPHADSRYEGEESSFLGEDDFICTGDRVVIDGNRVRFLGRASGVINVGGDKVYPEIVERVLNSHDCVLLSRAHGKRSQVIGELVVADVIVKDAVDKEELEDALHALCKTSLSKHARPARISFVDSIAVSENGKVLRV